MDYRCYYNVLGVSRSASLDEIRQAHRKLVLEHHPDRGGDAGMFELISKAYDTLKDPIKRSEYDSPSPLGEAGQGASGLNQASPLFQLFKHAVTNMVESHQGQQRVNTSQRLYKNAPVRACVSVPIGHVYNGGQIELDTEVADVCTDCTGRGCAPGAPAADFACRGCNGLGFVDFMPWITTGPRVITKTSVCRHCNGSGVCSIPDKYKCAACMGACVQPKVVRIRIDIHQTQNPADYRPNAQIAVVGGMGGYGSSCRIDPGDIVVTSRGVTDPDGMFSFSETGHLVAKCTISLAQSLRCEPVSILHPSGKRLRLRPPPCHVIQPFKWYVVRGQSGLAGNASSNLYVDFTVQMPHTTDCPLYREVRNLMVHEGSSAGDTQVRHNDDKAEEFELEEVM